MRKIVYAIVAGSLLVSGSAYAAGTTTPAKDQQTTKQVKAKPMKVKHASKHTKKNAKPAPAEPKNG